MKYPLLLLSVLLFSLFASAQKREEFFNFAFKPQKTPGAYYYAVTEKKDSLWYRQAYFISQRTMALKCSYKDDSCKILHGPYISYHHTGYQKSTGNYVNNKKEGTWLSFDEKGMLSDSSTYADGKRKGISMSWYDNGMAQDSLNFDGNGNGVQVSWYKEGQPHSAGLWTQDTVKKGRWKYYHRNGTLMATEDFSAGKIINCACYDEQGKQLDSAACVEKEPVMDKNTWRRFLEKNLQWLVEQKAKEGLSGQFTVVVRFLVNTEGDIEDVKALTSYGHGIEEGVLKIMKQAPKWTPGQMRGRKVKSYHSQPITFVIQ